MIDHTIALCLTRARQLIEPVDAYAIIAHVLGCSRAYLMTHPGHPVTEAQYQDIESKIVQREDEYPLAYIVGHKEFWSLDLKVTPDVLIPRPDTECLVETALQHCPQDAHVLELATGSGAIACALAHERKDISVLATDISTEALAVAAENISRFAPEQVRLLHSDWFSQVPAALFDMIIANPPYLADDDAHLFDEIRYEPRGALVAGENGYADIYTIVKEARAFLKPHGILLLEHGYEQGAVVGAFMREQGYKNVILVQDLSGHDRVTYGSL